MASRLWTAFALMFLASALPLLSVDLPPLLDYPNHLARMAILAAGGRDAGFDRFYAIHWAPLPDLAMDAIVPPLMHIMPLMLAGRVFLVLLLAVMAAGPLLLARALQGRWSFWALAGFLLLYNRILLWGFLNYLFGIGLALWVAAFWVMLGRRPVAQLAVAIPGVLAVFFCHIEAVALLGLILAGLEAGCLRQGLRTTALAVLRLALAYLAPVAIVLARWHPQAGHIDYAHFWRKADLLFSVFDNYSRGFDVACFAIVLGLLIFGLARRHVRVSARLLPALALVTLAYLAVPTTLFSGSAADRRVPVLIFLLLAAGLEAGSRPIVRATVARGLAIGLAVLFVARLGMVEAVWRRDQPLYRADLALLDQVPPGSLLAVATPGGTANVSARPLRHFPVLAAATRHAFVPSLFADPAQQPVLIRPAFQALTERDPGQLWDDMIAGRAPAGFDDVIMVDDHPVPPVNGPCLRQIGATSNIRLFQIMKSQECR